MNAKLELMKLAATLLSGIEANPVNIKLGVEGRVKYALSLAIELSRQVHALPDPESIAS